MDIEFNGDVNGISHIGSIKTSSSVGTHSITSILQYLDSSLLMIGTTSGHLVIRDFFEKEVNPKQ